MEHVDTGISHVFVVMLENHSFDHLLGLSGITGKDAVTGYPTTIDGIDIKKRNISNQYERTTYWGKKGAVDPMTTDPGHEFMDTLAQLCGQGVKNPFPKGPYPYVNGSGFVANYATSQTESTGTPHHDRIGDVLAMCDPTQVKVLVELATEFAVCDSWFSAMPGPTWPNRLFAMGASSSGLDCSPNNSMLFEWNNIKGFSYKNGSIFDKMAAHNHKWKVYNDRNNKFSKHPPPGGLGLGSMAIAGFIHNVHLGDMRALERLPRDLTENYPYKLTFIEPNYGDVRYNTYSGGSSQHPMDGLAAGEALLAFVYNSIRKSPIWCKSLLIITYDEHGGFYDHYTPPSAPSPDDLIHKSYNVNHFDFTKFGVRVPAVIVSPRIKKNSIDHRLYDHCTISKTLAETFGIGTLTKRDFASRSLKPLLDGNPVRTDCPSSITAPDVPEPATGPQVRGDAVSDAEPLPESGNIIGFLHIAHKLDMEIAGDNDVERATAFANYSRVKTVGDAEKYAEHVRTKIEAVQASQDLR